MTNLAKNIDKSLKFNSKNFCSVIELLLFVLLLQFLYQ